MTLVKFVTFVVLKILDNLVSMQNSLNANNCWSKQNFETVQRNLTFILNGLSEPSIHFTQLSIVLAKTNVSTFTENGF